MFTSDFYLLRRRGSLAAALPARGAMRTFRRVRRAARRRCRLKVLSS